MRKRRKLGIFAQKTLDGIWEMVKTYIPEGRNVREFWSALVDLDQANPTFPATPPVWLLTEKCWHSCS